MYYRLRQLKLLKVFVEKLKFLLALSFFVILAIFLNFLLPDVKADNLAYNENFTTTTYEDVSATTGRWNMAAGNATLLGHTWTDLGQTREGNENVTNTPGRSGRSSRIPLSIDSGGNPFLIWVEGLGGKYDLLFTRWLTSSWSGMTGNKSCFYGTNEGAICSTDSDCPGGGVCRAFDNLSYTPSPSLLGGEMHLTAGNIPYVFWYDDATGNNDIYFTKWTAGAGSGVCGTGVNDCWTAMGGTKLCQFGTNDGTVCLDDSNCTGGGLCKSYDNISHNAGDSGMSSHNFISIGSNDIPYLVWADNTGGADDVYFTKWTIGAGSAICGVGINDCWTNMAGTISGPENVSNTGGVQSVGFRMKLDSANNPYIIWNQNNNMLWFTKWTPGTGWTKIDGVTLGAENLSGGWNPIYIPELEINSNIVYVSWHGAIGASTHIGFTRGTPGGSWTKMDGTPGNEDISPGLPGQQYYQSIRFDTFGHPFVVWRDAIPHIRFTKWNGSAWVQADGITAGSSEVSTLGGSNYPNFMVGTNNIPYVTWMSPSGNENNIPPNEVYFSKWTIGAGPGVCGVGVNDCWTNMEGTVKNEENISNNSGSSEAPQIILDSSNNPFILWYDKTSTPSFYNIFMTRWKPDYNLSSTIQSLNVNTGSDFIASAKITATQTLNGQTINYFLSNDGATTWEPVNLGDDHIFSSQGTDLRWRAVLISANNTITPVIDDLQIIYQPRKITCSLSPASLTAGQTVTINAAVTFAPTSVWATVENNGTLLTTATMSGSGGNYSADVLTNNNYNGQDDVAIFASDGTQTYVCNPSTGANWQELTVSDIPWANRSAHRAISYNGKMYVMGGLVNDFVNDVWSSSDGLNWNQEKNSAQWEKRGNFGLIEFNGQMWLMGGNSYVDVGDTSTFTYYSDIWSSTDGKNWILRNNSAPWGERTLFGLTVYNNELWLAGGVVKTAGPTFTRMNDVWHSSDGFNWTQATAAAAWGVRHSFPMLTYDDGTGEKLWVIGGQGTGATLYSDVWNSSDGLAWNLVTNTASWGTIPGELGRAMHQSFVYNGKMWLLGGDSSNGSSEVDYNDVYNSADGITWDLVYNPGFKHQSLGSSPGSWTSWSARRSFPAIIYNNNIWVLGGYEFRVKSWNDVWQSSDGANWNLIGNNYAGNFGTRWFPSMVSFLNRLWIFGGLSQGTGLTNDVWSSADGRSWTQELANNSLPGPNQWPQRLGQNAVVFDNKLWVVGGCTQGTGSCLGYCLGGPNNGLQCNEGSTCGAGNTCQYAGLDDVWYTSNGTNWTQAPVPSWSARYAPTLNVFNDGSGDKLWLTGGWIRGKCNGGTYSGSICTGNANCPGGSCSRYCVGGASKGNFCVNDSNCDGSICRGVGTNNFLNDVWFSDNGLNWYSGHCNGGANAGAACDADADCTSSDCQVIIAGWSGRFIHSATTYNDGSGEKLWVMGGYGGPASTRLNDVWSTANGINWTQATASAAWTPRYTHSVLSYNDRMYLFGGNQPTNFLPSLWTNDVWTSTNGINWTLVTNTAEWTGRDFFSSAIFQNRIVLMGGDSNGGTNNDVWASDYDYLHFTVGTSSPTPGGSNPNAPSNLTCVAQSNSVIRWNFTDNANNETGFKLRDSGGVILETNTADLSYLDESNLQTNTQYRDRQVTAFNNGGESDLSNKASCYTLANIPAKIEVHSVAKDSVDLDIEATDNNPTYTVYAIRENTSGKYVQADGSFGDTAVWQTEAGWGGETGIKVIGGTANTNTNVNAQLIISLAENTGYSFSVKAKNGDGVETAFSDPVAVTTGVPATVAPLIVATKGVAIGGVVRNGNNLVNNLIKTAQAQTGIVLPSAKESHLILVLRSFGIFLGLALLILIILLISGLLAATRHLAKGANLGTKLKLAWQILSQEPVKVFKAYANKAANGTYAHAYEKHRSLHLFTQKNFQRIIGLAVIDIMILSYVTIGLNHSGIAQTAPYDQSGVEVKVGDKLSYIIELENQGTGEATGMVVADTLSPNLAYVAGSGKININGADIADGVTVAGQALSFAITELEANLHGYVTFDAEVIPGSEDKTITNQAQVSGNFTTLATNTTTNHVKKAVIPINTNTNGNTNQIPPPGNTNVVPPVTPPGNTNVVPPITPPGNINLPPTTPPGGNINVPVLPPANPVIGSLIQNETVQAVAQFFTSPETKKTSQNVVTPILLGLAAINTLPTVIILTSYLLPYLNLLFVEPLLLFFRKKRQKWGIVYDSLSKMPIGLALVRLYSKEDNRLMQTKVTDKEGRYIMIVNEPGSYYLSITKPGYEYPSRYLRDEKQDTKYIDLYHGEALEVKEQGVVVTANIPLDPMDKKAVSASEAVRSYLLTNLRLIISYLGIILALIVVLIYPTAITIGSLLLHVIFFVMFRRLIIPPKPKSWGIVYDETNKQPLHYALVRILDTKFNKLLETQVTDARGRYSFLVGKNEYQLLAEKQGYQPREIKPVDLVNKATIVDLDVALKKASK